LKDLIGINFGLISAILIATSGIPYMWAIYKRELKRPVISTWILWSIIGILLFIANLQSGAKWSTTLWPIFMGVVNPIIILTLSIRYGDYSWNRLDSSCMVVCVVTMIIWQTTESPLVGVIGGVVADALAAAPQVVKSWKDPRDEPLFPWMLFTIGSALNLLAVEEWILRLWLFPVYMTIMGSVITLPLLLDRLRTEKI
jgi:hypothetical protein